MTRQDQQAVVVGASRGLGLGIAEALAARRYEVIAVARDENALAEVTAATGARAIVADATEAGAPARILGACTPSLLVIVAGAPPVLRPIQLQSWESFSHNWNVDTKIAFEWVKAVLLRPPRPDTHVVVVSSGAALQGSPLSGGYAGAKRAQWFLAEYAMKEARRAGLGVRFHCLLPSLNPSTELGRQAIAAYADREGIPAAHYAARFAPALTPSIMGDAVVDLHERPEAFSDVAYRVAGAGLQAL